MLITGEDVRCHYNRSYGLKTVFPRPWVWNVRVGFDIRFPVLLSPQHNFPCIVAENTLFIRQCNACIFTGRHTKCEIVPLHNGPPHILELGVHWCSLNESISWKMNSKV